MDVAERTHRIMAVVGARPNLVKMAPLLAALRSRPGLEVALVHTGQHYDERLSELFFRELGLPRPDHHLGVGSGSHAVQTAAVMVALEELLIAEPADLALVVGDVNSTVAAALVAAKLGVPLAHVEAGLRSFDRSMPEEVNRVVTDALADLLFVTEPSGVANLSREGVPAERVFLVGNVMIDTLLGHRDRAVALGMPGRLGLEPRQFALATLHRPSNVDEPDALARMVEVLEGVAARLPVVVPLHPRTARRLEESGLDGRLRNVAGCRLIEPLGYLEFLGLMAEASIVLTDSGGVQEETTALGVSCLTLRENTERPVTLDEGTNRLVGSEPATVLSALDEALRDDRAAARRPELWDGHTAPRIAEILVEWLRSR